ncbi:MAG: hypothetical protein LPJ86_03630 [Caulobacteraceae bacterium]|nr:hypothetical protein [Caulobacteraceae bacterium]MDX5392896.1 hypothetical protein [Caulobacteraceae bacterium]
MTKLTDTLVLILKAERQARALRRRYGEKAEQRLELYQARGGRPERDYGALVARALEAEPARPSAQAGPGMVAGVVGLTALALMLVPSSPALAKVAPAVSQGAQACLPMLAGETAKEVAKTHGVVRRDGVWQVEAGGEAVEIAPPGAANPNVCALYISHAPDEAEAIFASIDGWATAPDLGLARVRDREPAAGADRQTSVWAGEALGRSLDVVLSKDTSSGEVEPQSMLVITAR